MKSILPEKEDPRKISEQGWSFYEQVGRNQAIEDCETALKKAVDEACDTKELIKIIKAYGVPHISQSGKSCYIREDIIADALSKHIRGCFYKGEK